MPQLNSSNILVLAMAAMLSWVSVSVLLAVIRLNRSYELGPNKFIYPANCKPELCLDQLGFIRFMTPRLWAFGLLGLAVVAVMLVNEFTDLMAGAPDWFSNGVALFLAMPLFVWYIVFISKAARRFW